MADAIGARAGLCVASELAAHDQACTFISRPKLKFHVSELSVKVSVKHKPTGDKKFQTIVEKLGNCVKLASKYVVFESESHPFRQFLQGFYEFPKNRKTRKKVFFT